MDPLRVSPRDVKAALDGGEPLLFLDVRSPEAWEESDHQIPGSVRLPLADFDTLADQLPPDRLLICYCT